MFWFVYIYTHDHLIDILGGFDAFSSAYPQQCEKAQPELQSRGGGSLPPQLPAARPTCNPCIPQGRNAAKPFSLKLPPMTVNNPVSGPFTAPMPQFANEAFNPFFSNIRQNMELSHGPIRERFSVRLPTNCKCTNSGIVQLQQGAKPPRCLRGTSHLENDAAFVAPRWMREIVQESGPKKLAEMYEVIGTHLKKANAEAPVSPNLAQHTKRNWNARNNDDCIPLCITTLNIPTLILPSIHSASSLVSRWALGIAIPIYGPLVSNKSNGGWAILP